MPKKCDINNISIEDFFMGISALEEELTLIPAYLLHGPRAQTDSQLNHSVNASSQPLFEGFETTSSVTSDGTKIESRGLKRKKNEQVKEVQQQNEVEVCLNKGEQYVDKGCHSPQQTQMKTRKTLLDISNVQKPKKIKAVVPTTHNHEENTAVTQDTSECSEQCTTSIRRTGRGRGRGRGGRGRRRRGGGGGNGTIGESTYSEMLEIYRLPEPVIRKSTRKRKQVYLGEFEYGTNFDTSAGYREFCEKTQTLMPVHSVKSVSQPLKEDHAGKSKQSKSDVEIKEVKKPRGRPKQNPKSGEKEKTAEKNKQSQSEDVKIMEVRKTRGRSKQNPKSVEKEKTAEKIKQSKSEDVKITEVKKPRGRPKQNQKAAGNITEISVSNVEVKKINGNKGRSTKNVEPIKNTSETSFNVQLRKSTRSRKINYKYGEDSFYECDEDTNWLNSSCVRRNQIKNKAQKSTANTSNVKKSTQKQSSKKLTQIESKKNDTKLKKEAIVKLEYLKDQRVLSRLANQKKAEKQDTDSGSGSTQKIININKKTGKKAEQPVQINKNLKEKTQPEAVQSAEDFKITAKRGTLKYLQQREKYIESMTKEAQDDDDFSADNPFFAKKKFKFTSLLPASQDETLTIMTPKRDKNADREDDAITPRTALLGQLQPLTPTTEPYSPFPTLDKSTKKHALKQVYRVMRGKKRRRVHRFLENASSKLTSGQNLPFTLLELPAYQESGNESDTSRDEYFSDNEK